MPKWLLPAAIVVCGSLLAGLSWVFEVVDVFFSGLLVLFTALVFWTNHRLCKAQRDFQTWEIKFQNLQREDKERRENSELVTVGKVRRRHPSVDKVQFTFWVSNPSPAIATLHGVRIENLEQHNCSISRLSYKILYPVVPREGYLGGEFPAPVFSGGLTEVYAEVSAATKEKRQKLGALPELKWKFEYNVGNYKTKTTPYERSLI